jgi:dTDP-4-dehydrorhamnose 3,5-epimerase
MKRISSVMGVQVFEREAFADDRGTVSELYNVEANCGILNPVQCNHAHSLAGTLRGMHYQQRSEQGKLVSPIRGTIYDAAVDVREGSATFGRYFGTILKPGMSMWVPPGFAHGFYSVTDSEVIYLLTDVRRPELERTLHYYDIDVSIRWPFSHRDLPAVSERDRVAEYLLDIERWRAN